MLSDPKSNPSTFDISFHSSHFVSLLHSFRFTPWLISCLVCAQADKRYQLADWRVRPLAPELLHYARSDTHYLLYIHDRLKQELQAAGDEVGAMH